jgi:phage shock protein PspC (stress-responsive transcriptional regulator)
MSQLVRPRSDRVLGGVCAAIANRFDMSAWVVRAAMIAGVVFFGLSFWLYLVLWLIIPGERP